MRTKLLKMALCAAAAVSAPMAAQAGGPLFIDPATLAPIHYKGPVRVYTDLGALGRLSNEAADAKVAFAWKQWTDVPTSSFEANVVGDVSALGLGDITVANASQVIGSYNGGGIHVVYDNDGTILRDYFGAPSSVLGIATPEYGIDGTPEIVESWVILNGSRINSADTDGSAFAGVMTHEFGHSINLGHSQVNGAIVSWGDPKGPQGCTSLPYAGAPAKADVETMYPFLDIRVTGTGIGMSTVDVADDITSLSNIYPAPGWPQNTASISGTITTSDGVTPVQGINVVARNVANPWKDAVSLITGDLNRADASVAGKYTLNGLTPGAQYVVYVDGIVQGGFSMPPAVLFPGPEEFFSGAAESGNALEDAACSVSTVTAEVGVAATADIAFNRVPGAPEVKLLGGGVGPNGISGDGKIITGVFDGLGAPAWRWTEETGVENLGGNGGRATISADGTTIVSNEFDEELYHHATILEADGTWRRLPSIFPGFCGGQPSSKTSAYGVSNHGRSVVGLAFDGEFCAGARAFRWDAETDTMTRLETPDGFDSRANGISGDGRTVWGWLTGATGFRESAIWVDGTLVQLNTPGLYVGEAIGGSTNGNYVVGGYGGVAANEGWLWSAKDGLELLGGVPGTLNSLAFAVNDAGTVVVGQSRGFSFERIGWIWTRGLGVMRLQDFLRSQGTYVDPSAKLDVPNSISADGTRIAGGGGSPRGPFGWVVDVKKVKVCHAPPGNPTRRQTIEVSFPEGLNEHLAHGDTLGSCDQ